MQQNRPTLAKAANCNFFQHPMLRRAKVDYKIQYEQSNGERTDGNGVHESSPKTSSKRCFAKPEFNEFPTQSPVCNRDDGLPFRVADLTISFAKWRSKSIEALGNAWVPQVAFEIFKAIEENYKNNKAYEENNV